MRRATGDAFTRPSPSADGAGARRSRVAGRRAACGVSAAGCALLLLLRLLAGFGAPFELASPASPMRAIGSPIGSVSPSSATISSSVPSSVAS